MLSLPLDTNRRLGVLRQGRKALVRLGREALHLRQQHRAHIVEARWIDAYLAQQRLAGQFHQLLRLAHQIAPTLPSREQLQYFHAQAGFGQVRAREVGAGQNHTSAAGHTSVAGRTSGVRRQYQPSPQGTRTLPWAANRSR